MVFYTIPVLKATPTPEVGGAGGVVIVGVANVSGLGNWEVLCSRIEQMGGWLGR